MSREMKHSGIPWIGEVPKEWEQHRFKYAGTLQKGKLPTETNVDGNGLPIIGASEMLGKPFRQYSIDKGLPECNINDILILWDGANAGIVASGLRGIVSSTAAKYSCNDSKCYPQYTFYLLKGVESYFRDKVFGTTIPHMNDEYINDVPLLLPSIAEQQRIAEFLDKKCGEVDEMIALQEQIIEELKAYKQSVITEAVTKGLNPNVPMKDSGIEWIGEIPEHWEMRKLKQLCTFHNGDRSKNYPNPDEFIEDGIPFYGADSLNGFIADLKFARYISEQKYISMGGLKIEVGDILYTLRGSTIGKNAMVTKVNGTIASSLMGIRVNNTLSTYNYLIFWLHSICEYIQRDICINGSTAPNLSAENVKEFFIFLPSLKEQQAIADYLDNKCGEIDALISIKQQKIESLKEYKKSIIYEYVTGKKEVV